MPLFYQYLDWDSHMKEVNMCMFLQQNSQNTKKWARLEKSGIFLWNIVCNFNRVELTLSNVCVYFFEGRYIFNLHINDYYLVNSDFSTSVSL